MGLDQSRLLCPFERKSDLLTTKVPEGRIEQNYQRGRANRFSPLPYRNCLASAGACRLRVDGLSSAGHAPDYRVNPQIGHSFP